MKQKDPADRLICECEMVPQSVIASIISNLHEQGTAPDLEAISLRSRMGKGSCQGTFCSVRADGYLLEHGELPENADLSHLKTFLRQRWKGQHPISWGERLVRAEFLESVHCGLLGLEKEPS
jgi:glycerol-3-phosphate dehydrogenase